VALVHAVVAEQQATTERHQLVITTAEPELVGSWDAVRLERVLGNLLSNAIKFSPRGGEISVSVGREDGAGGTWAVLAVSDRGLGIPADEVPHIFEHFHRAANVAGSIPGSGVGLASVRHILEQHGGSIAVVSHEGEGSTFTVRLPLGPASTLASRVATSSRLSTGADSRHTDRAQPAVRGTRAEGIGRHIESASG
jgi:signal transduction histidine kinase